MNYRRLGRSGLQVSELSPRTQAQLREFLPREAGVRNPVDMIASAPADAYGRAMRVMATDPNVDMLLVIFIPPIVTSAADVAHRYGAGTIERSEVVSLVQEALELDGKNRRAAAAQVDVKLLRIGSRGSAVASAQRALGITADGIYGPKTRAAVKAFQERHGLVADGIVGPQTRAALAGGGAATAKTFRAPWVAGVQRQLGVSADVYVDGKLAREGVAGRVSIPVSSERAHTLELRSATGTKTFANQTVSPYGLLDLGTFDFKTMPADP